MSATMYSAEQVATMLGLHVRTVRGYVRDGRLPAVRMGKQYRIAERDLRAFTGEDTEAATQNPSVHISSVVHVDSVDRTTMDRVTTHVTAAAIGGSHQSARLHVHSAYDESRCRLTIFVVGDLESTSAVIGLIGTLTELGEP